MDVYKFRTQSKGSPSPLEKASLYITFGILKFRKSAEMLPCSNGIFTENLRNGEKKNG